MRRGDADVAGGRNAGGANADGGSSDIVIVVVTGAGILAPHRQRLQPWSGQLSSLSLLSDTSKQPSGATSANTSALCRAKTASQQARKSRTAATIARPVVAACTLGA